MFNHIFELPSNIKYITDLNAELLHIISLISIKNKYLISDKVLPEVWFVEVCIENDSK